MSYHSRDRRSAYRPQQKSTQRRRGGLTGLKLRLGIAAVIVVFSLVNYALKGDVNRITGERQRVDLSIKDEIILGLQSVPQMGVQSPNRGAQLRVDQIGQQLVTELALKLREEGIENPYPFDFHLIADDGRGTVNAFALPGGQIFVTEGLYRRLSNDGELAGVLGHEIGHVIERHGAARMAKGNLFKGIVGAAGVVGGGDQNGTRLASWVTNLVQMKYGRADELESDRWGVQLMVWAGYDPSHLITVMDVLEESAGGNAPPEFMSTHPRPANRRQYIRDIIAETFPDGIPQFLK